jgi:hypothetical protein
MPNRQIKARIALLSQRIGQLVRQERSASAWHLLRQLKIAQRVQPLHVVFDVLMQRSHHPLSINKNGLAAAAEEIADLPADIERDRLWRRLAIIALYYGDGVHARHCVLQINDEEERDYALSSLVQGLISQDNFNEAYDLLPSITTEGARIDAIQALVKALLQDERAAELSQLISDLTEPWEKAAAARTWYSTLLAQHKREAAEAVHRQYALG